MSNPADCPCCGCKGIVVCQPAVGGHGDHPPSWFVQCRGCGLRTKNFFEWSVNPHTVEQFSTELAIKAWNARAPEIAS